MLYIEPRRCILYALGRPQHGNTKSAQVPCQDSPYRVDVRCIPPIDIILRDPFEIMRMEVNGSSTDEDPKHRQTFFLPNFVSSLTYPRAYRVSVTCVIVRAKRTEYKDQDEDESWHPPYIVRVTPLLMDAKDTSMSTVKEEAPPSKAPILTDQTNYLPRRKIISVCPVLGVVHPEP